MQISGFLYNTHLIYSCVFTRVVFLLPIRGKFCKGRSEQLRFPSPLVAPASLYTQHKAPAKQLLLLKEPHASFLTALTKVCGVLVWKAKTIGFLLSHLIKHMRFL